MCSIEVGMAALPRAHPGKAVGGVLFQRLARGNEFPPTHKMVCASH